jgi:hypothetical protein
MVVLVVVFGRGAIGVLLVAQSVGVRETLDRCLLTRACLRLNAHFAPQSLEREENRIPQQHRRNMTTLLSLPTEVLINILIAVPNTRTLLRLSKASRRLRSIWLDHTQHIVASAYKKKIPHIEEAIALTLVELRCGEVPSLQGYSAYHLCLPRVLRNAGLATSVCDSANRDNKLEKIEWETEDKYLDMLRAYYLIRHTLLAYDHPELRPSVYSALSSCTGKMHAGNNWLAFFMVAVVSMKLTLSHGLLECNLDAWDGTYRDPDQDPLR